MERYQLEKSTDVIYLSQVVSPNFYLQFLFCLAMIFLFRVLYDFDVLCWRCVFSGLRPRDIRSIDPSLFLTNSVPSLLVITQNIINVCFFLLKVDVICSGIDFGNRSESTRFF